MVQIIPSVTDEVRMAGAVRSTLDKYKTVRYEFMVRVWSPDGGDAGQERLLIGAADREGNRAIAAFRILPNGLSDAEDYPHQFWAAHLFEVASEQVPSAGE